MSMTDQSLANGVRKTGEALKGVVDQVTGKGGESAHRMAELSKERIDQAFDVAAQGAEKTQTFVTRQMHDRPLTTTAAALGAGVLIGLLLSRR